MSKYQDSKVIIDNLYKYSQFYLKILQADFDDLEVQNQIIMITVFLLTIFVDLIMAVGVGITISSIMAVYQVSRNT